MRGAGETVRIDPAAQPSDCSRPAHVQVASRGRLMRRRGLARAFFWSVSQRRALRIRSSLSHG
jgi:hypothetical protein